MGLREEKKKAVRRALVDAAIQEFRTRGMDRVAVREIAEAAQVSPATFFNYFPSKSHLIDAWLVRWLAGCFPASEPGRNLRQQIRECVREISRSALDDRSLLKTVWPRARVWRGGPPDELVAAVQASQSRGDLRHDLPAACIAGLLSAAIDVGLGEWLAGDEDCDAEELASRLMRGLDLVLDGSRKRNERVRARAASSPHPA